jgi:hypothetical protein
MSPVLRRFAWWSFFVTELGLVAAAIAYVGFGTRAFWLVVATAAAASIAYVITVRATPLPTRHLDVAGSASSGCPSTLDLSRRHAAGMPLALRILAICPAWSFQW